EGSGRLLFLVQPRVNPGAEAQFGPWAYRGTAATYFNLLWPICLCMWFRIHRCRPWTRGFHHVLLLCAAIMAACPIISASRGGALVTIGLLLGSALFLIGSTLLPRSRRSGARRFIGALTLLFVLTALGLGLGLGRKALLPRLAELRTGF